MGEDKTILQTCFISAGENLIKRSRQFNDYVKQYLENSPDKETEKHQGKEVLKPLCQTMMNVSAENSHLDEKGKLIKDERVMTGNISFFIFKDFINKFGNSIFCIYLMGLALQHVLQAGGIFWLSDWIEKSRENLNDSNKDAAFRLGNLFYLF